MNLSTLIKVATLGICSFSFFSPSIGFGEESMKEHMKNHKHEKPGAPENLMLKDLKLNPNEVMIQVNGVVCSFCSQGIRKKLSKFSFIDRSKYKKGVKMDIKKQRCFVASKPETKVDMKALYQAIKDGGYEPVKGFIADSKGTVTEYKKEE